MTLPFYDETDRAEAVRLRRELAEQDARGLRLAGQVEELRHLLLVAYDALFFERGMTPQDRDAMRHALETVPREVTPIHTDP